MVFCYSSLNGLDTSSLILEQNKNYLDLVFAKRLNVLLWDGDYVMGLIHEVAIPEKRSMMNILGRRKRIAEQDFEEEDYVQTDTAAFKHMGNRIQ